MFPEVNRRLRGHRFYPTARELARYPKIYQQDGLGMQAIVHVHYFGPFGDWWITEFSPTFGQLVDGEPDGEAFGYVRRAGYQSGEFCYIDVPTLERTRERARRGLPVPLYVERDLYWTPAPLAECIRVREAGFAKS